MLQYISRSRRFSLCPTLLLTYVTKHNVRTDTTMARVHSCSTVHFIMTSFLHSPIYRLPPAPCSPRRLSFYVCFNGNVVEMFTLQLSSPNFASYFLSLLTFFTYPYLQRIYSRYLSLILHMSPSDASQYYARNYQIINPKADEQFKPNHGS